MKNPGNLLDMVVNTFGTEYAMPLRQYLFELLKTLWKEGSGFDSKRPFGYSDWQSSVYKAMVRDGFIDGELNIDGECVELVEYDKKHAEELMELILEELFEIEPR
jgi:hypothetical protein